METEKRFLTAQSSQTTPISRWKRNVLVAVSWVGFSIAFVFLYPMLGPAIASASMVPVVLMAWLYGARVGFIASLQLLPLCVLLLLVFRLGDTYDFLQSGIVGGLVAVLSGITIGRLRDVGEQLKQEATERNRAERRIRQQMEMLSSLYAGARQLAQTLNLREIATEAVQTCVEKFHVDWAGLYQIDQDERPYSVAQFNSDASSSIEMAEQYPFRQVEHFATRAILEESPILAELGEISPDGNPVEGIERQASGSLAGFALIIQGRPFGALLLQSQRSDFFTPDQLEFFQAYSNQVAAALNNAYLYREQQSLATTDSLTGLTNRRSFDEILAHELSHSLWKGSHLALLMLDIDHFKKYNDSHGHLAGDNLLAIMAAMLQNHIRSGDTVARYGGEEFAVILPNTDGKHAHEIAERIRLSVAENLQDASGTTTISIGIAVAPVHAQTSLDLIHASDMALYRAKQSGRNCVVVYTANAGG